MLDTTQEQREAARRAAQDDQLIESGRGNGKVFRARITERRERGSRTGQRREHAAVQPCKAVVAFTSLFRGRRLLPPSARKNVVSAKRTPDPGAYYVDS
jgi:hypothetical protein